MIQESVVTDSDLFWSKAVPIGMVLFFMIVALVSGIKEAADAKRGKRSRGRR